MAESPKIAMVTGASSGIGKACAIAFVKAGYRTAFAGRRLDALKQAVTDSGAPATQALAIPTDVTDPKSVEALFRQVRDTWGRVDVLFNNAGVNPPGISIEDMPYETWKNVVDTNFTGVFLCMQQAFRIMKDQTPRGGRIINNGSISAHAPRPNSPHYSSTKHAVTGLTKCGSLDGRKYDIAVGQIDIGNALTDMSFRFTKGVPQANGDIAVEAVMDVQHVASTVLHMASLPAEANVQFVTVMATKMPFVGRG